jgi:hypothetical protein
MQFLERGQQYGGQRRTDRHQRALEQILETVALADTRQLQLATGLRDEVRQRCLRGEERVGPVGLDREDRRRLVLVRLDLDRGFTGRDTLRRLRLDHLLRGPGGLYGDALAARGVETVDPLRIPLVDGEDDVLLDVVDERRLLLPLDEVTGRAQVQVVPFRLHPGQHTGQSVHRGVLDLDSEELTDRLRQVGGGALDRRALVGADDHVRRERTVVDGNDLAGRLDLVRQLVVQGLVDLLLRDRGGRGLCVAAGAGVDRVGGAGGDAEQARGQQGDGCGAGDGHDDSYGFSWWGQPRPVEGWG